MADTSWKVGDNYPQITFDFFQYLEEGGDTSIVDPLLRQLRQVKRMSPEYHQIWRDIDKTIDGYKEYNGMAEVLNFIRENGIKTVPSTGRGAIYLSQ